MKIRWDVNDHTIVQAKIGGWTKSVLTVNGRTITNKLSLRKKNVFEFTLDDGRAAVISVTPQFATVAAVELRVDGRLMAETGKQAVVCANCKAAVKPNDQFCGACGHAMPDAEHYAHRKHLKDATSAITVLAVLFVIFGFAAFFMTRSQNAGVLAKLDAMDPASTFPKVINGVTYTVAALHDKIAFEASAILIVNVVLAITMGALAWWSRRAPLPAVLIAAATYAVVLVGNLILDPATIAQGLFVKVIIITLLARGIKAALALRAEAA